LGTSALLTFSDVNSERQTFENAPEALLELLARAKTTTTNEKYNKNPPSKHT
jgi:hypothetical protein